MESSLWSVLVFAAILIGAVNSANVHDESEMAKKLSGKSDQANNPIDMRVRVLEAELQRVKTHLSEVENLLEAWFLSAEQQGDGGLLVSGGPSMGEAENGVEKRAGGFSFMGSRGKRKQPFILGSRGKRAGEHLIDDGFEYDKSSQMDKRGAYFYGSRGKKQFVARSLDDQEYRMPPFNNKRYAFMGSRGKK